MITVRRSTIIDAPIGEVWRLLRDFNAHDRWHPAVAESEIEDRLAPDQIAAVRSFRLADGAAIREQLLALSDRERSFTYCILDAPLPLEGYVATLRLRPVTDGERTLWEWESRFSPPADQAEALAELVGEGIYQAGFDAVKRHFGQRVSRVATRRPPERPAASGGAPVAAGTIAGHGIVVSGYGGPEVLEWRETEAPAPGPGEVRVRHSAIGVNFIDVYCRTGAFDLLRLPGSPGMEAAGVVESVGPGVSDLAPGDRVAYACPPVGAYQEVRTLDAELLVQLPDDVTEETAAAALLKGMTAGFLLHRVHAVKEGDWLLVHAAAGGVGSLLVQWAAHLGARVIGTVGSAEKARRARQLGCAEVVLYREEDVAERVMAITGGHGADVVYDAIGRDSVARSFQALALRGHIVSYGQAAGPLEPLDIAGFAAKSATVSRPNYGHYAGSRAEVRPLARRLFDALRAGILRVEIGQRYPLREVAQAHRDLEGRRTTGSTILVP